MNQFQLYWTHLVLGLGENVSQSVPVRLPSRVKSAATENPLGLEDRRRETLAQVTVNYSIDDYFT